MNQPELFEETAGTSFDAWVHTDKGREIAYQFIRLACGMKKRGFTHYSGWAIVNTIRWHHDLKYGPDSPEEGFKINNNWIADLSRFAMNRAPSLKGFFRIREKTGEYRPGRRELAAQA